MRDHIFRSVELLIYVFDIESEEEGNDFSQYVDVVEALEQHSPDYTCPRLGMLGTSAP